MEAESSPKMAFKKASSSRTIAKCDNLDWYKSLYHVSLKAKIHVLSCRGSSIEAIWMDIDTHAQPYLARVRSSAIRLCQISFKCQEIQAIGEQESQARSGFIALQPTFVKY